MAPCLDSTPHPGNPSATATMSSGPASKVAMPPDATTWSVRGGPVARPQVGVDLLMLVTLGAELAARLGRVGSGGVLAGQPPPTAVDPQQGPSSGG